MDIASWYATPPNYTTRRPVPLKGPRLFLTCSRTAQTILRGTLESPKYRFDAVVNVDSLTHDPATVKQFRQSGARYHWIPFAEDGRDFVKSLLAIRALLEHPSLASRRVLLHGWSGTQRPALVAVDHLVRIYGLSIEAALRVVRRTRPLATPKIEWLYWPIVALRDPTPRQPHESYRERRVRRLKATDDAIAQHGGGIKRLKTV
jgi:protein-tyrosine phosphatase